MPPKVSKGLGIGTPQSSHRGWQEGATGLAWGQPQAAGRPWSLKPSLLSAFFVASPYGVELPWPVVPESLEHTPAGDA